MLAIIVVVMVLAVADLALKTSFRELHPTQANKHPWEAQTSARTEKKTTETERPSPEKKQWKGTHVSRNRKSRTLGKHESNKGARRAILPWKKRRLSRFGTIDRAVLAMIKVSNCVERQLENCRQCALGGFPRSMTQEWELWVCFL
jgi:hypothetical protein